MLLKNPSKKVSSLDLFINGTQIEGANSIKFFGVNFTPHLKWNKHSKIWWQEQTKESTNYGGSVRSTLTKSACWPCINHGFGLFFSMQMPAGLNNLIQLSTTQS